MAGSASAQPVASPATLVRAVLAVPDRELNYARAKIALDRIIDPSINAARVEAELDRLAQAGLKMAGPNPTESQKLGSLQRLIYVSGPWNDNRPFSYDMADPLGQNIQHKLLADYLKTRKGNCVSMPILFLVLGEKMGLKGGAIATAPLHYFIRYTKADGAAANLETTDRANFAPLALYRKNFPMTDRAIESGIYMRALPPREGVGAMGGVVIDYLMQQERYADVPEVADVLLQANPRDVYALLKRGTAYAAMLEREFVKKYATPVLIPAALRPRYNFLATRNREDFAKAEALGWQPD